MTAIIDATGFHLWKLTSNRFRILVLTGLSFVVMC